MSYQLEIECKCHIDKNTYTSLIKTLSKTALSSHVIKRDDTYYLLKTLPSKTPQNSSSLPHKHEIRIRDDNGIVILTYKEKTIAHGIEQNKEYQSRISNKDAIETMLQLWGAEKYIKKQKRGVSFSISFSQNDIKILFDITLPISIPSLTTTIELLHVPPLGYFFEIETIHDKKNTSKEFHSTIRNILLHIIQYYGIHLSQIEDTPYTKLLLLSQK